MAVCSICGKIEIMNDPVPENPSMTFEDAIDKLNSIGCTSFVVCSDCAEKYIHKITTPIGVYPRKSLKVNIPDGTCSKDFLNIKRKYADGHDD